MFHLHANIQRANYIVPHLRETGVIARTIKEWIVYNYTIFWLIDNVSRKRSHSGNNVNNTDKSTLVYFKLIFAYLINPSKMTFFFALGNLNNSLSINGLLGAGSKCDSMWKIRCVSGHLAAVVICQVLRRQNVNIPESKR